jgi:hypothetical protein
LFLLVRLVIDRHLLSQLNASAQVFDLANLTAYNLAT